MPRRDIIVPMAPKHSRLVSSVLISKMKHQSNCQVCRFRLDSEHDQIHELNVDVESDIVTTQTSVSDQPLSSREPFFLKESVINNCKPIQTYTKKTALEKYESKNSVTHNFSGESSSKTLSYVWNFFEYPTNHSLWGFFFIIWVFEIAVKW